MHEFPGGAYKWSSIYRWTEADPCEQDQDHPGVHLHGIPAVQPVSAYDGIEEPDHSTHEAASQEQKEAEDLAYHYLDVVGLRDKAHVYPTTLSGGQQQRIAIARALCAQTKIILFDEPTSALDPETIQEVLDVMIKLAKENITMVVVTHEMGFARQVADRIVFMADGQIIEEGTPDHFFDNPSNERVKQFLGKIIR